MTKQSDPTSQQMAEAQAALAHVPSPLPPEHVNHDAVFYNEVSIRRDGFRGALSALDAEIEGKKIEREEKIAEIERIYTSDMASLDKRRTMMMVGIEMAEAALDAWHAAHPQEQAVPAKAAQEDESEES